MTPPSLRPLTAACLMAVAAYGCFYPSYETDDRYGAPSAAATAAGAGTSASGGSSVAAAGAPSSMGAAGAPAGAGGASRPDPTPSGGSTGQGTAGAPPLVCGQGQKVCSGACADVSDPAFGCSPGSCAPCNLDHATARCGGSSCRVDQCDPGFGDCDDESDNGCETDLMTSRKNCGECGKRCDGNRECRNGECRGG